MNTDKQKVVKYDPQGIIRAAAKYAPFLLKVDDELVQKFFTVMAVEQEDGSLLLPESIRSFFAVEVVYESTSSINNDSPINAIGGVSLDTTLIYASIHAVGINGFTLCGLEIPEGTKAIPQNATCYECQERFRPAPPFDSPVDESVFAPVAEAELLRHNLEWDKAFSGNSQMFSDDVGEYEVTGSEGSDSGEFALDNLPS